MRWCSTNGCDALPASTDMVLAFVGHLAQSGTVHANSLQPYLSSINAAHADQAFPKPALGHMLRRARQGFRRLVTQQRPRDTRVPVPAQAIVEVLTYGLGATDLHELRGCYAVVLTWLFLGRQDSSVRLKTRDHGLANGNIWLRISEKTARCSGTTRVGRLPTTVQQSPPSLLPMVARLARRYVGERSRALLGGLPPPFFFQLPNEPPPTTATMSRWVASTLAYVHATPPAGFVYQGPSLRSGDASAAEAIGVPAARANWLGGWAVGSTTREKHYVDPTVPPSEAAWQLLGWLKHAKLTC